MPKPVLSYPSLYLPPHEPTVIRQLNTKIDEIETPIDHKLGTNEKSNHISTLLTNGSEKNIYINISKP